MKIIVDIDNTLSLSNDRFNKATKENGKIDWNIAFNDEYMILDKPNISMIEISNNFKDKGYEVIILTGRPESTRNVTEKWLDKFNIQYDKLYMRNREDHFMKADLFKKKIYETYIKEDVICAFDDEQSIIDMWMDLKIPAFKIQAIQ